MRAQRIFDLDVFRQHRDVINAGERRSAALRLACRKSSMPCSAMILVALCARARRRSSARCENFLGIGQTGSKISVYPAFGGLFGFLLSFVHPPAFVRFSLDELFHDAIGVVRARKQAESSVEMRTLTMPSGMGTPSLGSSLPVPVS